MQVNVYSIESNSTRTSELVKKQLAKARRRVPRRAGGEESEEYLMYFELSESSRVARYTLPQLPRIFEQALNQGSSKLAKDQTQGANF